MNTRLLIEDIITGLFCLMLMLTVVYIILVVMVDMGRHSPNAASNTDVMYYVVLEHDNGRTTRTLTSTERRMQRYINQCLALDSCTVADYGSFVPPGGNSR